MLCHCSLGSGSCTDTMSVIHCFLFTQADGQGVDISVAVCWCVFLFACLFVRLRFSPLRIKLVASHFARRFIGVQGRESPIFVNFASPEDQNRTNRPVCAPPHLNVTVEMR